MHKQIREAVKNVKRLGMTGYTYGFVYHVVMLDVVILQKNKHATKHFKATEHPIIKSFEPGEEWKWCYVDETFMR
jgi:Zn-finger in ubiquitin-hydrolases and other protein